MKNILLKLITISLSIMIIYFLFKLELFNIISIAYCEKIQPKNAFEWPTVSSALPPAVFFTGSMMALNSLPVTSRAVTGAVVTASYVFFKSVSQASEKALNAKITKSGSNSGNNNGFKAPSIIEQDLSSYCQYEYFIFIICFFLIIFALISFTITVMWVIVHKYDSWVIFLKNKIQSKLLFAYVEKIKKISPLKIMYLVFFVYINLCLCVYLLLTFF